MPRGKKTEETTRKKGKKVEEEEEVDDDIIEEEDQPRGRKKAAPKKGKKSRKDDDEQEDELSDIDIDEEAEGAGNQDTGDNDEIVPGQKFVRKVVDPKTAIGKLKPDEILNYCIQLGEDACNPQLKFGALNLLNQLTGRRRKPQGRGGARGGYNTRGDFNQRGGGYQGRGRGNGYPNNNQGAPRQQNQYRGPTNAEADVYDDIN